MVKYYEYKPDKVINNKDAVLICDVPISYISIPANRPVIMLHKKHENTCLLIVISVVSVD